MGVFTKNEMTFLARQSIGRLATLTASGDPTVVPVGFEVVGASDVRIVGYQLESSAKAKNLSRDARFAFVVDEGIGETARGILIRGRGSLESNASGAAWIRLVPAAITSWGIDTHPFERNRRTVDTEKEAG